MGNATSNNNNNRRNNNNYVHHQPSPAPLPYPPQNYFLPQHPSNYLYAQGYNSCNYANPMMMAPHYYANQINGWSSIRPTTTMGIPVTMPAPYVEHRISKKVQNDVNVHKDTLRIEVDEHYPDHHLISFVFDALSDGSITLYYFAKEESDCKFIPLFPEAYIPMRILFQKGLGQNFRQPSGTGIDLGFFELGDLSKASHEEDVFPLVIAAETGNHVPNVSANMQITQAVLEKTNDGPFQVKVVRQILWVNEVRYELREIYGIGSSSSKGFNDNDLGKECIICMTEPKDTAVLPCRHMCMCSECAKELRLQSDKCPICRQPIEELIEIKINN